MFPLNEVVTSPVRVGSDRAIEFPDKVCRAFVRVMPFLLETQRRKVRSKAVPFGVRKEPAC